MLAAGAVVLMAAIWGFNWTALKLITQEASPFVLTGMRITLGSAVLFLALVVFRRPLRSPPAWPTFTAGMLQNGIFMILQNFALLAGAAGKTSILAYTMPLWVVALAPFWLGERITPSRGAALLLGLIGLACVLVPLDLAHGLVSKLLALGVALLWAAGVLYTKQLRARYDLDVLSFTAWQMIYSTPVLVLAALVMPGASFHPGPNFWPLFLVSGIGGTAVAFLLFMWIVARLSASAAGLSVLLVPVMAILNAAIWLGERPTPIELVGTAVILTALAVNSVPQRFDMMFAKAR